MMNTIKALVKYALRVETCECPLHSDVVCVAQACCRHCAKAVQ